ncbi:hypothetical protein [Microbulbifer sp. GL-2]|uniref:hypothetical protein n=1 Tax=Microbulbifer sp. GL-2 TaxID=2591606 RepID=UPI001165A490|nr:hypothetical protein [Microbulbifer sp. GL-2]BBM02623.1 hypothetical protein GL2_26970 [Microbulbifer sp. GL-2]
MRHFTGLTLTKPIPDETTILNCRHLLEVHQLARQLYEEINSHLKEPGMQLKEGSIVDVTIINAASSKKNRKKARDPEMYQTKKGGYPFRYIKRVFGYDKVRYQGQVKNTERLCLLAGFINLLIVKKYLAA